MLGVSLPWESHFLNGVTLSVSVLCLFSKDPAEAAALKVMIHPNFLYWCPGTNPDQLPCVLGIVSSEA